MMHDHFNGKTILKYFIVSTIAVIILALHIRSGMLFLPRAFVDAFLDSSSHDDSDAPLVIQFLSNVRRPSLSSYSTATWSSVLGITALSLTPEQLMKHTDPMVPKLCRIWKTYAFSGLKMTILNKEQPEQPWKNLDKISLMNNFARRVDIERRNWTRTHQDQLDQSLVLFLDATDVVVMDSVEKVSACVKSLWRDGAGWDGVMFQGEISLWPTPRFTQPDPNDGFFYDFNKYPTEADPSVYAKTDDPTGAFRYINSGVFAAKWKQFGQLAHDAQGKLTEAKESPYHKTRYYVGDQQVMHTLFANEERWGWYAPHGIRIDVGTRCFGPVHSWWKNYHFKPNPAGGKPGGKWAIHPSNNEPVTLHFNGHNPDTKGRAYLIPALQRARPDIEQADWKTHPILREYKLYFPTQQQVVSAASICEQLTQAASVSTRSRSA